MKIRSVGVVVFLFLSIYNNSSAQHLLAGVRVGPNLSTVAQDEYPFALGFKPGITIAPFVSYALTDNLYLHTELGVVNRGYSLNKDSLNKKMSTVNLELPLMLRTAIPLKKFTIALMAGPSASLMLTGNYKNNTLNAQAKTQYNDEYAMRRAELGLNIGLGIFAPVGKGMMGFDTRYYFSITNLTPAYYTRYRTVSFTLSYAFRIDLKSSHKTEEETPTDENTTGM